MRVEKREIVPGARGFQQLWTFDPGPWGNAERCKYRLQQAEICNFLSQLFLDAAEEGAVADKSQSLAQARKYAELGKELASCDGEPHHYKQALDDATRLMVAMPKSAPTLDLSRILEDPNEMPPCLSLALLRPGIVRSFFRSVGRLGRPATISRCVLPTRRCPAASTSVASGRNCDANADCQGSCNTLIVETDTADNSLPLKKILRLSQAVVRAGQSPAVLNLHRLRFPAPSCPPAPFSQRSDVRYEHCTASRLPRGNRTR